MPLLRSPLFRALLLLGLSLFVTFIELGRMDVTTENEGQRSAPPKHMLRTGDFVVPELNGKPYLAKPPLLYWATAGVYAVTGVQNEWASRFVTAASSIVIVLAVYLVLRRKAGDDVGFLAALGLASTPYFIESARFGELDQPLMLFIFLAVCALHTSWTTSGLRSWAMVLIAGACIGAATLLKGPVPYLFIAGAYVAFVLTRDTELEDLAAQGLKAGAWCLLLGILVYPIPLPFPLALVVLVLWWLWLLFRAGWGLNVGALPQTLLAVAIGVGVTAPWAWLVVQRLGWENVHKLLNGEVVERTYTATAINSGFPLYYVWSLPFLLAPFALLLPVQLSSRAWRDGEAFYKFSLAMAWYSIVIFSLIAGKEYEYVMPCAPLLLCALAYPLAEFGRGTLEAGKAKWFGRWAMTFRVLCPVLAVGVAIVALVDDPKPALSIEAVLLAAVVVGVSLIRLEDKALVVVRIAVCAALVITGWELFRAFRQTGVKSPREMAYVAKELVAHGVPVEATKIYAAFNNYAELPIPIQQDAETVRQHLTGADPYFYITTAKILKEFPNAAEYKDKIVLGPIETHDLVMLGNRPVEEVLSPEPAGQH